jgi:hypothetical protein
MANRKENLKYVHAFGSTALSCGRNILELTTYDNITMWWFLRFRLCHFINGLAKGRPKSSVNLKYLALTKFYGFFEPYIDAFSKLALGIIIRIYNKNKCKSNKYTIIITSQDLEWRDIRDLQNNSTRRSDAFFDSILQRLSLNSDLNLVGIYPVSPSIASMKIFIDKQKNWYIQQKPFNIYSTRKISRLTKESRHYFKSLWEKVSSDSAFREICRYDNVDLYEEIVYQFKYLFTISIPHEFKYIKMAEEMITRESPDLILIENEYSQFQKSLIAAAKIKRIPTIAIQHGVINSTECGYIFDKADRDKVILPDITCVYGKYHYDVLTDESIYERQGVIVTGQPRYDILFHAKDLFSKERFMAEHGINTGHKILLWTTQCHAMSDEANIQSYQMVFAAAERLHDATLIIKQHPNEGRKYTRMIEESAGKYNASIVITPKDSNTYEQLFVCDLMIAKHSATAMEAVAMDKPVIILNIEGEPDIGGYVSEGVALGVSPGDDLVAVIERLLSDDSELKRNRAAYIERYLYRIDGKASQRVADLIMDTLKRTRKEKINSFCH